MSHVPPIQLNPEDKWVAVPRGSLEKAPPDAVRPVCAVTLEYVPGYEDTDQDITDMLDWYYVTGYVGVKQAHSPRIDLGRYAGTYGGYTTDVKSTLWQRIKKMVVS